jgi:hypothetical protein
LGKIRRPTPTTVSAASTTPPCHGIGVLGDLEHSLGFGPRKTQGQRPRRFELLRGLVDIGGQQMIRFQSDLLQQRKTARRGGRQDQLRGIRHGCTCFPAGARRPAAYLKR